MKLLTYLSSKSWELLNGKNDISHSSGLQHNEICFLAVTDSGIWNLGFTKKKTYFSFASAFMIAKSIRWLGDIHRWFSATAKALPPKPNMAENPKRRNLPMVLKVQTSTGCICPWMLCQILRVSKYSQNGKHRRAYLFSHGRRKCQVTLYCNKYAAFSCTLFAYNNYNCHL